MRLGLACLLALSCASSPPVPPAAAVPVPDVAPVAAVAPSGPPHVKVDVYRNPNEFEGKIARLEIGDKAPDLRVEEWIKGKPIDHFGMGTVHIIEFFGSWCRPCQKSIPHLNALQRAHGGEGLRVVAVAAAEEEGPEDLRELVKLRGDGMEYAVAYVNDEATFQRWMWAARVSGLPWAFIIDKNGRVAWWGQPFFAEFDDVVAKVLAGTYDIGKQAAAQRSQSEALLRAWRVQGEASAAFAAKDWAAALTKLDQLVAMNDERFWFEAVRKFEVLLVHLKDTTRAYAFGRVLVDRIGKNNPHTLSSVARLIATGEGLARRDLDMALAAIRRAEELTQSSDSQVMSVYASVLRARGDRAGAIERQKKALALAPEKQRGELETALRAYEAETR